MTHAKQKNVDSEEIEIGYSLISEEHEPNDLVHYAQLAENAGFKFATISDHYHPWTSQEGQSPFVWAVIGAVAHATKTLRLGTAVTCPTMRIHPAIVAQAASTAGCMMEGRFFFGVGTGENLNEHILGSIWPTHEVRASMLEEAVELIRELWRGKNTSYYGNFYVVENAHLFTIPRESIPIMIAAEGPRMAKLAAKIGDGLICTSPNNDTVKTFKSGEDNGDLPCYGQTTVCFDVDEESAKKVAHKQWPITGIPGEINQELPTPTFFEQAAELVTEEKATEHVVCGNDPEKHLEGIRAFLDAGFRKVTVHNIGYKQEAFFKFYREKVIPHLKK